MRTFYLLILTVISASVFSQTTCFPDRGMKDTLLEKDMVDYWKKWMTPETEAAVILNEEWMVDRNENSGVITGREVNVTMVTKKKDKCFAQDYRLGQEYNGKGYLKTLYVVPGVIGDKKKISCDCLNELKKR